MNENSFIVTSYGKKISINLVYVALQFILWVRLYGLTFSINFLPYNVTTKLFSFIRYHELTNPPRIKKEFTYIDHHIV